jgi:hypothetical protein
MLQIIGSIAEFERSIRDFVMSIGEVYVNEIRLLMIAGGRVVGL